MATRRLLVEILGDDASLQRALGASLGATTGFGDRLQATGRRITSVGKSMTRDLTLPILAIGGASAKAAIDFQNSMELLHTQAGVGQAAVDSLSKSVLALAGPTATAPDTLSAGLYHLASQGLRGKDALDALKIAAEGAKLGQADLEDVTNALGAVIVSQIGGVHGYGQAMGELNAIVGTGDMRMQDLADAMGTGLPASAKIAGVSLDQIGGALATFGDNNIRGAKAGTLLNSTLRIMAAPSAAAQKALASVGIGADQLGNTLRSGGLVDAVQLLKDKMDAAGLSATQQGIVLTEAFGGRQATGVKILVDELDRLKTKTEKVGAAGGDFASKWASYTDTTAYHMAAMGAKMQAAGITIGDVLLPVVAKVADFIGNLVTKFENLSPAMQKTILVVGGVLAAIGPVVSVIGDLSTAIGFLISNPITLLIGGIAILVGAIAAAVIWPDKLKAVLEHMGLSAHAAGEVVAGLQDVFKVVERAVMYLVGVIRDNWSTISAIVRDAVDIISTVIRYSVGIIEGIWRDFGGTLTSIAKTIWGYIKGTVKNGLEVIRGIFDVITGLIHGDWSKVWKGITEILGGSIKQLWNEMKTAVSLLGDAAKLIGNAIVKWLLDPLLHLAEKVIHAIEHAFTDAVHAVVDWIPAEAAKIGEAIAHGIAHGFEGAGSWLKGKFESGLHFLSSLNPFSPVEHGGYLYIGLPIAQGAVRGYLEGIRPLPGKISASLRTALEAARKQVDASRSTFASAFSNLQSAVDHELSGTVSAASTNAGKQLAALLAQYANPNTGPISDTQTAAGKQLAALQAAHAQQQLQQALADAKSQLSQAQQQLASDQASGADASTIAADKQQIVSAQQGVADAEYQIQVAALQAQAQLQAQALNDQAAALQKKASLEAKHATAMRALRKHEADQALAALKARLSKEGATEKQAHDAIVKLLKKYGVTYHDVARDMGVKFAKGLEEGIHLTAKAAEALAKEIAKYLPHSPAEKGPLSKPLGWQSYILGDLGNAVGAVSGAFRGLDHIGAPSGGGALLSAAGANSSQPTVVFEHVQVTVDNFIGTRRELEDAVVDALSRFARRNGNSSLRSVLKAAGTG